VNTSLQSQNDKQNAYFVFHNGSIFLGSRQLTKKAEPPPTRDVNRDSGTDRANGGWLRRLVGAALMLKSSWQDSWAKDIQPQDDSETKTENRRTKRNQTTTAWM